MKNIKMTNFEKCLPLITGKELVTLLFKVFYKSV